MTVPQPLASSVCSVRCSIRIHAPLALCFALSTDVALVQRTLRMQLVAGGMTEGHVTAGSRVHWRGLKFGLPTHHHTLITGYQAPHEVITGGTPKQQAWFQDSQERGRFAFFQHDHFFSQPVPTGPTTLHDEVRFTLPFGPLGRLAARLLLAPYIRRLARQRFRMIQQLAESDGWRQWL